MGMHSYYKLSEPTLLLYYNIVGVDLRSIDLSNIETEGRYLEDLSPLNNHTYLPASSYLVDEQMQILLERLCTEFGYGCEHKQEVFFKSIMGIMHAVTNINIIDGAKDDFATYFERLNTIIIAVLREINSLQAVEVMGFFRLIKNKKLRDILDCTKVCPTLALLAYLGLNPDSEINDYIIFDGNNLNYEKLVNLINEKAYFKTDYEADTSPFMRPNFISCQR